ncbi:MAG: hypothetical protein C0467_14990 [Planctomycetaceae bacterium]|nr:hypothetical protein [Planctomycetaceae bacterium]
MSMIACPGCGLPRAADQLGTVPCPVCAATPTPKAAAEPIAKKSPGHDPTAGLPADVREMHRAAQREGFPSWFNLVAVFLFGIASGVGGLLSWQAANAPTTTETARAEPINTRLLPPLPPKPPGKRVEVAPMPHTPSPPPEPKPEPEPPKPEPQATPLAPERAIVIELNLAGGVYNLPFAMKKGERIILKGKVGTLRTHGLDAGSVLDASGLEAAQVHIGGKIDNGSTMKINAPKGTVTVAAAVLGKSTLEIVAPGGDVLFSLPTTANRPGSAIDSGSTVSITAQSTHLKGDINGSSTKVTVNLPAIGSLKVAAIRGTANVEYHVADGKGTPEVTAAFVSPVASFKKVE